jgi:hypothetical protein
MRTFVATISVLILSGCTFAPLKLASETCFGSTDVLRYNHLYISLQPDGSYTAELQGDIGMWGTAKGSWSDGPKEIFLKPISQTGEEVLRSLKKANSSTLIARPIPGTYDYKWEPMKIEACRSN